jgi:hypothetical protein
VIVSVPRRARATRPAHARRGLESAEPAAASSSCALLHTERVCRAGHARISVELDRTHTTLVSSTARRRTVPRRARATRPAHARRGLESAEPAAASSSCAADAFCRAGHARISVELDRTHTTLVSSTARRRTFTSTRLTLVVGLKALSLLLLLLLVLLTLFAVPLRGSGQL